LYTKFAAAAIYLLLAAGTISSALAQVFQADSVAFSLHQKKDLFSIEVPDYLVEVDDLTADAALQLKNDFNATYLMVLYEPKSAGKHATLHHLAHHFKSHLLEQGGLQVSAVDLLISGCNAYQSVVELSVDEVALVYLATFLETETAYFKIYAWTLASQHAYLDNFREAARSFVPAQPGAHALTGSGNK
jgi:hypothetical protein